MASASPSRNEASTPQPVPTTVQVPTRRSGIRSFSIILTALCAMLLQSSGETGVAIAMPTIGEGLHIPDFGLQWLVNSFALSSGCLLLTFGRIADLYGRRRVFLVGTFVHLGFALGCSFAPDPPTMFVLRALQGLGIAAALPAAGGTLAQSFPPGRMRGVAFSTFSAGGPIGAALGMTIGGVLTESSGWRSIFYLPTVLSVICLLGGYFAFDPDPEPLAFCRKRSAVAGTPDAGNSEQNRRVDWAGSCLVTIGLILLVFVLGQGAAVKRHWAEPYIPSLFVVGLLFLALFVWWQWFLEKQHNQEDVVDRPKPYPPPLMPVGLWLRGKGRYAATMAVCFLNSAGFFAWTFWIQLLYQNYFGLSPLETVIRLIPMFVVGVMCNVLVALVVTRVRVVFIMGTGTLFTTIACLLIAIMDPNKSYWAYGFPAAILIVFGADFTFASGSMFIAQLSKPQEQSVSSALFQTMMAIGSSVGVACASMVWNVTLNQDIRHGWLDGPPHAGGPHRGRPPPPWDGHGPPPPPPGGGGPGPGHAPGPPPGGGDWRPPPPHDILPHLLSMRSPMFFALAAGCAATLVVCIFFWKAGKIAGPPKPPSPSISPRDPEDGGNVIELRLVPSSSRRSRRSNDMNGVERGSSDVRPNS